MANLCTQGLFRIIRYTSDTVQNMNSEFGNAGETQEGLACLTGKRVHKTELLIWEIGHTPIIDYAWDGQLCSWNTPFICRADYAECRGLPGVQYQLDPGW